MRDNMPVHYSAEQYDQYTQHSVDVYDAAMIRRILLEDRLRRRQPRTLLDIGTGTAQLLVKIAALPKLRHYELIGTDFFEDMVQQARLTVKRCELESRITIEQCDVHTLPYTDEFADFVISRSTIHHWADPAKAFQEIYRVLKPGGVAIIHEPRRNPHPAALAEFNRRRSELGVEPARMDEKYTPAEVRQFVNRAGIGNQTIISAPRRGPASLGFEVRISKCGPVKTAVTAAIAWCVCCGGTW